MCHSETYRASHEKKDQQITLCSHSLEAKVCNSRWCLSIATFLNVRRVNVWYQSIREGDRVRVRDYSPDLMHLSQCDPIRLDQGGCADQEQLHTNAHLRKHPRSCLGQNGRGICKTSRVFRGSYDNKQQHETTNSNESFQFDTLSSQAYYWVNKTWLLPLPTRTLFWAGREIPHHQLGAVELCVLESRLKEQKPPTHNTVTHRRLQNVSAAC